MNNKNNKDVIVLGKYLLTPLVMFLILPLILLISAPITVHAMNTPSDTPFQGYNYNHWSFLVPAPAAYAPVRTFGLSDIAPGIGEFTNPSDVHVDPENNIYVVDRENHRIVVFDTELNLIKVIDSFIRDGRTETLNMPSGVFVTPEMEIFIADTNNHRIVILNSYGNFVREITSPEIEGLEDDFLFLPLHVLVDRGGRVFVIVQRVFEGIMSFNAEGEFLGYFGTISLSPSPIDLIWRFFMTQEQRERQIRFIPTEFQAMSMDSYGFVFTTNIEPWATNDQVMRLNPRGEDVLVNFNDTVSISGDQRFRGSGRLAGPSAFTDIVARSHGMYSALDSTRSRVFTYDSEGNLLYVFGGTGNIQGMMRRPVALEMLGDDILILDAGRGQIVHFEPTEYGRLINTAIAMRYDGRDQEAVDAWRQLVLLDENFALAWAGIGRSMLAAGDNVSAMYYLQIGQDVRNYSIAFRRNRVIVMRENMAYVMNLISVLVVAYVGFKIYKKVRKNSKNGSSAEVV